MRSILITGCNRGLGLGLVRELLKLPRAPEKIIATCRDLNNAKELQKLAEENKAVHILSLEVTNTDSLGAFATEVANIVKDGGLNVLFNNAGYSPKYARLPLVKESHLLETFKINTVAPIMLAKALLPLLKQAAAKNSDQPIGASRALIVNMSSVLGSIAENTDGGLYPYRCSKSALNAATKSMSRDLQNDGIMATCLHPGWVKTDMGGKNAPLEVESSTTEIVALLSKLTEQHNGKFVQYDGKEIPW